MDTLQLKMCDIQGRLFELSLRFRLDSKMFISSFMKSEVARQLDSTYNRMQWAGEEYLLEELRAEVPTLRESTDLYDKEMMYWIGYLYRCWNIQTGESSKEIYHQANEKTMRTNYLMFHTMSPEMAIEDLKEIYRQRNG